MPRNLTLAAVAFVAIVLPSLSAGKDIPQTILKSLSPPWGEGVKAISPQQISKDDILVAAGTTLYLLDQGRQVKWRFDAGADINGFAYVEKTDSVYVIAMDLTWLAIDAKSGRKRWSMDANGRATFAEIAAYGKDKYVVVTGMSGYDGQFVKCEEERAEGKGGNCKREDQDIVQLIQDKKVIGTADFPPDAHLAIVGENVWAVSARKDSVSVERIRFNLK